MVDDILSTNIAFCWQHVVDMAAFVEDMIVL